MSKRAGATREGMRGHAKTRTLSRGAVLTWVFVVLVSAAVAVLWPRTQPPGAREVAKNEPLAVTSQSPQQAVLPDVAANEPGPAEISPETATKKSKDLVAHGTELLKAGDPKGAISLYQKALAESPKDEDLHFNLGVAYARSGAVTNAEAEYREALRLLPDYPEAHNNLGNLLLNTGRMQEAEEHLTEAVKLMPEYAVAQNSLGVLRQKQHRANDALECFEKAVRSDTNYWQAQFNLGNAYFLQGQKEKAVAAFKEVLRVNPSYPPAERALAKATGQSPKQDH